MSDDVLLDHAAQLIADARVACLKLAIPPEEIAKIMMDEAILALMAERLSLSDIQARFKKYTKRDLPRFYINLGICSPDDRAAHVADENFGGHGLHDILLFHTMIGWFSLRLLPSSGIGKIWPSPRDVFPEVAQSTPAGGRHHKLGQKPLIC
jgi:hypothetical protein